MVNLGKNELTAVSYSGKDGSCMASKLVFLVESLPIPNSSWVLVVLVPCLSWLVVAAE